VSSCPTTGIIAELAVSQVLGAAKAVSQGTVRNAFCAIRPPGHHCHDFGAHYDGNCQGEGFCFYSNVAIAARYVQQVLGHQKILIIDWDYHYGNGTNWVVKADPSVMFYSTHNFNAYPGTGDPAYTGEGAAVGHTVNVHLPPGAEGDAIINAWDNVFAPRMQQLAFAPDFVLISAGFDSKIGDPLGSFRIMDDAFVVLTTKAMAIAEQYCNGRLLSVLEGGYNTDGLGKAVCAHTATLAGLDWRQYVPESRVKRPRGRSGAGGKPYIRGGMLYVPEPDVGEVTRVVVFDAAGREVYSAPSAELGKPIIDLWPPTLSAGVFTVLMKMRDGSVVRVPFAESK
jgi:acetoin utilization deacetylase AcuC-like enzyme